MRHVAAELLTTVTSTTIMTAIVLCLGTVIARPLVQEGDWPMQQARECVEAPVRAMSESGVEGVARLCTEGGGVQPTLKIRGLQEGEAYTAWLAYFDRPSTCFLTPCGFMDLRGDDPVGVLGRVSGAIAPEARELELRADLRDLHPSRGSQITLVVLSHGIGSEADGRARARQLLTPQMFDLGAPMAGAFSDRSRGWLHAQATFTIR